MATIPDLPTPPPPPLMPAPNDAAAQAAQRQAQQNLYGTQGRTATNLTGDQRQLQGQDNDFINDTLGNTGNSRT